LCLDRLLVGYRKHFVSLIVVIGLILTGILGAASILRIRDNSATIGLIVKVNRFLTISIWGYLVFVPFDIVS
jgi:hypothetical protein